MIAALAIVVTALSAMLVYYNILKEQVFGDLKAYAHVIELLNIDDLAAGIEKDPYNPIDDDLRITLIGAEGEVLYESLLNKDEMDNHNERPEIIEAREKGEGEAIRYSATSGTHTFYYAERLQNGNVLRIGRDSVSVNRIMVNTLVIVLVIALCILFVCMGISHYLTKKLVEPIEKLATNIMLVDENNVYEEIRPFVNTIKEQHVNIINNAQLRQEFTANVSHELKTPIALIQGYSEGLKDNILDDEESKEFYCDVIADEAKKMNRMVQKLLTLNQIEFGNNQVNMERFDITEMIRNMVESSKILVEKQEVKIIFDEPETHVWADEFMIEEVVNNYLSNARNHVTDGGIIKVSYCRHGNDVRIKVFNTGDHIPQEDIDKLWVKFYKVDKARTREYGGSGIGLSIVEATMKAHGKDYGVANVEGGVEFYFDVESADSESVQC
mgnify:CR=1 FL=1